ncbi:vacuolar ATP synthase subunit S1 [Culex quinquefasciatus]|uniref:Vacuolar ATP synthase subunit S1 n=1 Tax=Culex quinquefasciatus TaxID=7176 RepID=B0XAT3_CULQU|nr:vacuolar ATP synthase subunit S1 [Culex quinquefasciatus]|eukprot:XP_001866755.1 vacuolar ATP synthase subunit S1 [Culex quinquefasciatus]
MKNEIRLTEVQLQPQLQTQCKPDLIKFGNAWNGVGFLVFIFILTGAYGITWSMNIRTTNLFDDLKGRIIGTATLSRSGSDDGQQTSSVELLLQDGFDLGSPLTFGVLLEQMLAAFPSRPSAGLSLLSYDTFASFAASRLNTLFVSSLPG